MLTPRDIVQDMKPLDAVEYLLNVVDMTTQAFTLDHPIVDASGLTAPIHKRIITVLAEANGAALEYTYIFDRVYAHLAADELPEIKCVSVHVAHMRAKLPENIKIETVWGIGVGLVAPQEYLGRFPSKKEYEQWQMDTKCMSI